LVFNNLLKHPYNLSNLFIKKYTTRLGWIKTQFSTDIFKCGEFINNDNVLLRSYHNTNLLLTSTGFIFNQPLLPFFTKLYRTTSTLKSIKYSFFNIYDIKKTILRERSFYHTPMLLEKRIIFGKSYTGLNYKLQSLEKPIDPMLLTSSKSSNFFFLLNKVSKFDQTFKVLGTLEEDSMLQIRRIRFKPGYSRL